MNRAGKIARRYQEQGYLFHGTALDFIKAVAETKPNPRDGKVVRPQTAVLKMGGGMYASPFIDADLSAGKLVLWGEDAVLTY